MSHVYQTRPSQILGIENTYEAFCFDEACLLIKQKIQDGFIPMFKTKPNENQGRFSKMYKDLGVTNRGC